MVMKICTNITVFQSPSRPSQSQSQHPTRGFTLIEMLIVIAATAVLLAIGAPSMAGMVKSARISSASNLFFSGLLLARSEAIKRNSRVVLCKSSEGVVCSPTGGWEQGWIIFHDSNNNGLRDGFEIIIQRESSLSAEIRLVGNLNVERYVSFTATGATRLIGGGFQAGTLTVCNQSAEPGEAKQIVLNAVGRPRVQTTAISTCG